MQNKEKYKGKFRIKSNRLENYDYSENGGYFVTICTKNFVNYFGKIEDGKMILNQIGEIVLEEIYGLEKHFEYLILDYFIIMPNHLHIILFLEHSENGNYKHGNGRDVSVKHLENQTEGEGVSEGVVAEKGDVLEKHLYKIPYIPKLNISNNGEISEGDISKKHLYENYYSEISPKKGSLGNIIKLFKGYSSKKIKKSGFENFSWQSNYHDKIIRNDEDLYNTRKYILENPLKHEFTKQNIFYK